MICSQRPLCGRHGKDASKGKKAKPAQSVCVCVCVCVCVSSLERPRSPCLQAATGNQAFSLVALTRLWAGAMVQVSKPRQSRAGGRPRMWSHSLERQKRITTPSGCTMILSTITCRLGLMKVRGLLFRLIGALHHVWPFVPEVLFYLKSMNRDHDWKGGHSSLSSAVAGCIQPAKTTAMSNLWDRVNNETCQPCKRSWTIVRTKHETLP